MCVAQGHKAVMLTRLKPVVPRSRVKHCTTALPIRCIDWFSHCLWHKAWTCFLMLWLIFYNNCFPARWLILCVLVNWWHLLTFFQNEALSPKNSGTLSVSNSLDPDQDWQNVSPDLGPNCLQRLSANDTTKVVTTKEWVKTIKIHQL